jgi:hypothetical protein
MPEMPGVRLVDPRPISLRARDFTHLALAGLVRTLCDPEAPHAAVVNAAREMLDRGYGRAVEMKRTLSMGAFDGYSDADLDELIARLRSLENPAAVIDGTASQSPSAPQRSELGRADGAQTGSSPQAPPSRPSKRWQRGKLTALPPGSAKINLRLDIVPGMVWATPPATASRVRVTSGRQPHDRARRPLRAGLLVGGYLNPASLALHATPALASKGRLIR